MVSNEISKMRYFTILGLLLLCVCLNCIGLGVFLREFFSLKPFPKRQEKNSNLAELRNPELDISEHKTTSRTIFILIDALRADFIPSVRSGIFANKTMPFVEALLDKNKGVAYTSIAHSPTVTMPRIKAITSGSIPGFVDIIMNLNAVQFEEDNVISQSKKHNIGMVFYGDETWLKLFPGHFLRFEGTTSFFVSDYKEVDDNVTRHLPYELKQNDWKLMILHYLGLDHIGHSLGVSLPHLESKLIEMDDVIRNVYQILEEQDLRNGENSLILICGDHGMSSSGSHGGVSTSEILTPLIILSTRNTLPAGMVKRKSISQTDIAPTLATLLGVPIPESNTGLVITPVLKLAGFSEQQILYALYSNSKQILQIGDDPSILEAFREAHVRHLELLNNQNENSIITVQELYENVILKVSENLLEGSTTFDVSKLILGMLVCCQSIVVAVINLVPVTINNQKQLNSVIFVQCSCFVLIACYAFVCYTNSNCVAYNIPMIGNVALGASTLYCLQILFHAIAYDLLDFLKSNELQIPMCTFIILHIFSYVSSSFIEEEHQTWYFFCNTLLLLLILNKLKVNFSKESCETKSSSPYLDIYETIQDPVSSEVGVHCRSPLSSKMKSRRVSTTFTTNPLLEVGLRRFKTTLMNALMACAILPLFRISRSWNQTGDKWAHLPDIGDWLDNDCSLTVFTIVVLASAVFLAVIMTSMLSTLERYVIMCNMLLIGIYKSGLIQLFNNSLGVNLELLVSVSTYLHITLCLIYKLAQFITQAFRKSARNLGYTLKYLVNMWILLMLLLQRKHNFPLVMLMVLREKLLAPLIWQSLDEVSAFIAYYMLGMEAFFELGNSNSLSTVDIAAGYTGLSEYNIIAVGFLMLCNTFSGPIFWLLISVFRFFSKYEQNIQPKTPYNHLHYGLMVLNFIQLVRQTFYLLLVIIQRYHIFVWTVFSPKLLYEIAHVFVLEVFALFIIVASLLSKI